jgi:hypothetical protein
MGLKTNSRAFKRTKFRKTILTKFKGVIFDFFGKNFLPHMQEKLLSANTEQTSKSLVENLESQFFVYCMFSIKDTPSQEMPKSIIMIFAPFSNGLTGQSDFTAIRLL